MKDEIQTICESLAAYPGKWRQEDSPLYDSWSSQQYIREIRYVHKDIPLEIIKVMGRRTLYKLKADGELIDCTTSEYKMIEAAFSARAARKKEAERAKQTKVVQKALREKKAVTHKKKGRPPQPAVPKPAAPPPPLRPVQPYRPDKPNIDVDGKPRKSGGAGRVFGYLWTIVTIIVTIVGIVRWCT